VDRFCLRWGLLNMSELAGGDRRGRALALGGFYARSDIAGRISSVGPPVRRESRSLRPPARSVARRARYGHTRRAASFVSPLPSRPRAAAGRMYPPAFFGNRAALGAEGRTPAGRSLPRDPRPDSPGTGTPADLAPFESLPPSAPAAMAAGVHVRSLESVRASTAARILPTGPPSFGCIWSLTFGRCSASRWN